MRYAWIISGILFGMTGGAIGVELSKQQAWDRTNNVDRQGIIMADCFAYNDQSGNWDRLRNPDLLNKQLSWAH